jgi:hypothetical protein
VPLSRLHRDAAPNKGKAFWEAEVTKMIKVYGAPIVEAEVKAIPDYLTQTY